MTFGQKLARLADDRKVAKSVASKSAGLPQNAISDYIGKGYIPRADTALRLARVLGVSLDWLMDDACEWPPPPSATARAVSTSELLAEVGRRMHQGIGRIALAKISAAEETDWIGVGEQLTKLDPQKRPPPALLEKMLEASRLRSVVAGLNEFDPRHTLTDEERAEARVQLASEPDESYSLLNLDRRFEELAHMPAFHELLSLSLSVWPWVLLGGKPSRDDAEMMAETLRGYARRFAELRRESEKRDDRGQEAARRSSKF